MFVGRNEELATLDRLYRRGAFQMVVVYGRRRVGKTSLVSHFGADKRCLFFTAQQKSERLNLVAFSQAVYRFFDLPDTTGSFTSWADALDFVAERAAHSDPFVFVFDEFPYAAQASPELPSALQIAVDRKFQSTGVFLVLCGSNQGFMEGEVLGAKSPLYGRRTAQIKLKPLGYREAAQLMPSDDPIKLAEYYAVFGGTPYYLCQLDEEATLHENIERLFFDIAGVLYAEPQMLLRQELREPALYSSVLDAIGSGETLPKRIAERAGMEPGTIGRYLKTLIDLGIVERVTPFNENPTRTRRSIYRLADPFFAFWYRFVSRHADMIEAGMGPIAASFAEGEAFSTYVGGQFEGICLQWLIGKAKDGDLPFIPTSFGSWWGPDPKKRGQTDIDIAMAGGDKLLVGECKWRNEFDESKALAELKRRSSLVGTYGETFYTLFSKHPLSKGTLKKIAEDRTVSTVTVSELYA